MPFQMRDETAGVNILYVDNSNQMGLGSLPVNGQALTVQGNGFINQFGDLGSGVLGPGGQIGYEGVFAPGAFSAVVTISTTQQPTVSSTIPPISITTTQVAFLTPGNTVSSTINYSIW
jgi:hypothetical protein